MKKWDVSRRRFITALSTTTMLSAWTGIGGCARVDGTTQSPSGGSIQTLGLTAPRPVVWKNFLGLNAQFLWFTQAQYVQQIQMLQALGLEWVRVDLHWADMEPVEGQFQYAPIDALVSVLEQQQIKSTFYMVGSAAFASSAPAGTTNYDQYPPQDPQVYASRMASLASRYPGVLGWEIWNEPNLSTNWEPQPSPSGFATLLQASTQAIEQAAPGNTIIIGGMAYYSQMSVIGGLMLQSLASLGALGLGDIVAYHPYSQYPEGDNVQAQDFIVQADQLNSSMRSMNVPGIWANEWGWSSYAGPVEEQNIIGTAGQADYVLRRLVLMSAMDFDRIFLFTLSDLDQRATPRDQFYGLIDLQGNPKPVYTALANFLAITGPALNPAAAPSLEVVPSALYNIGWEKLDGTKLWMFWSANPGSIVLSGITSAVLYQPMTGASAPVPVTSGQVTFSASQQLQILAWS